ncbi:MAG: PAS domain-containing protein [Ginsengibacter sp.]
MLPQNTIVPSLNFLSGGGKMGEFVRTMDWSKTSVGAPEGWPQSLRTSVSICLNSSSPILIWWGKDLVKIYNDAYRDLIATKHPKAMGAKGADVWPEILPNVLPMLKGILKDGEATGSEDQLLVIERNGHSEVCYFTFSYSAIRDEAGNVGGIFCAVNETTKKVNAERKLSILLNNLFIQAPVAIGILRGKNYIVEVANKMILEIWGRTQNEVLNKPLFEALPEVKEQGFKELLDTVYKDGERFVSKEHPADLVRHGKMESVFVKFIYEPLREEDGTISGIMVVATEITEQVLARKKAEESEYRYQNMIYTSTSMILILKGENLIVEVANDSMLRTLGKGKDIVGQPLLEVLPEIIEQGLGELLHQVYATGQPNYGYELPVYIIRNGEKELSYYTFVYQAQRNVNGVVDGVAVIANEVTPQATFNIKIKESEERFRSLVQQAPVAMVILKGNDYTVEMANDAYLQIIAKGKDFIGKPLFESIPGFKTQGIKELLDNVMESGTPFYGNEMELYIQRSKKREQCFFNFVCHPVHENQDKVTGIIVVANEVTDQVLARRAVEESELHFRQMADLMPAKITNANADGSLTYFNKKWMDFTGMSFEDFRDFGYHNIVHPDELEEFQKRLTNAAETGSDLEMEMRFLNKEGEYIWNLNRASPVKDENGNVKMWIGVTSDIQKIKDEERQKDNFLSMASHELRTPVTTIKAYGQIAEMMLQENGDKETLAIVSRMAGQVNKLNTLIGELLDFTKIREGKLIYNEGFFDFNEFVKEAVEDMRHTTATHKILYIQSADARIFGDKEKLSQVVNNLISNGIKYSRGADKILVTTKLQNDGVSLSIQDYGIGIAKEAQDKVFEQFYRVTGNSQATYPGMGIGLYICAEIIKREGGRIWIESSNDKGSVFCIWLPFDHRNKN